MDNQPALEVTPSRPIRFTNPDDELPFFYANNTQLQLSNWDLQVDFGMIKGASETEMLVRKQVRIVMSLQHAKAFLGLVTKTLAAYEEKMGEIRYEP